MNNFRSLATNNFQCSAASEAPAFGDDSGRREAGQVGDLPDFTAPRSDSFAESSSRTGEGLLSRFHATESNIRRSLFRR
jgi:hypothetical protein